MAAQLYLTRRRLCQVVRILLAPGSDESGPRFCGAHGTVSLVGAVRGRGIVQSQFGLEAFAVAVDKLVTDEDSGQASSKDFTRELDVKPVAANEEKVAGAAAEVNMLTAARTDQAAELLNNEAKSP